MKVLNIIESAYRASLEEQDDTIVWLSHALKGAGAELDVVLQGNAVNYVVKTQEVSSLKIGACKQTQAPAILNDVKGLMDKGCKVFVVSEDLEERGLSEAITLDGITLTSRNDLAGCFEQYQQVWHW